MNLLIVSTKYGGGGAEKVARQHFEAARAAGHNVRMLARHHAKHESSVDKFPHWREERLVGRARRLGYLDTAFPLGTLAHWKDLFHWSDVIHLHNIHGNFFPFWLVPLLARRKPLFWTLHDCWSFTGGCGFPGDCARWRAGCGRCPQLGIECMAPRDRSADFIRWKRWGFSFPRCTIIAPCRWMAEQTRQSRCFGRAEIRVIPYGVDEKVFRPKKINSSRRFGIPSNGFAVALMAAGLTTPRKGIPFALRALALIKTPLYVLLIGRRSEGLSSDIRKAGHFPLPIPFTTDEAEIAAALQEADLFWCPSLADNSPLVIHEALACGVPVLAFAAGGIPELIQQERTGAVVPKQDVSALAGYTNQLLKNPEKRRCWGKAARKWILEHRTLKHFETAYLNLLDKKR